VIGALGADVYDSDMVIRSVHATRKPIITATKASASEIRAAFDIKPSHVKVAEEALRAVLAPRKPAHGGSSATKKTPNGVRAAAGRRQPA
jgi:hypothetical protein